MQNHIIKCLPPNKRYTFKTWDETHSMLYPSDIMDYLPHGSVVFSVLDADDNVIWSVVDGWSESGYFDAVSSLVSFIDSAESVDAEYTDQALADGLDVFMAVNGFFDGKSFGVIVKPHLKSLIDIHINDSETIHRAKLCRFIETDDIFNVYYGCSGKMGADWLGDLRSSLSVIAFSGVGNA